MYHARGSAGLGGGGAEGGKDQHGRTWTYTREAGGVSVRGGRWESACARARLGRTRGQCRPLAAELVLLFPRATDRQPGKGLCGGGWLHRAALPGAQPEEESWLSPGHRWWKPKVGGGQPKLINSERGMGSAGNRQLRNAECGLTGLRRQGLRGKFGFFSRPCRDLRPAGLGPGVETPGYYRSSLRDWRWPGADPRSGRPASQVGMARCAVRAASSGATCGGISTWRAIRSARSDAGGDIAARCHLPATSDGGIVKS